MWLPMVIPNSARKRLATAPHATRAAVSRRLEALRKAGELRGSLDATATVYCDAPVLDALQRLDGELRFVLLTSDARVQPAGQRTNGAVADTVAETEVWIDAARSDSDKCARCWHRRADVGTDTEHPELCDRCVSNVAGDGEQRTWA